MATKKIHLNLKGTGVKIAPKAKSRFGQSRCANMVILPGYGEENFQFPTVETLVINALSRLNPETQVEVPDSDEIGDTDLSSPQAAGKSKIAGGPPDKIKIKFDHTFLPGLPTRGEVQRSSTTTAGKAVALPPPSQLAESGWKGADGLGSTLFVATEGIRLILHKGRFDAIVADRFDPLAGAVNWAGEHMDEKYDPAIRSLGMQLARLQSLYKEALPRVLSVLAAQNPEVAGEALLSAAVDVLDREMVQILTVLRVWTDAFGQLRDGMYKQLQAVIFTVEQAFKLFQTGDLTGTCKLGTGKDVESKDGKCQPKLNTSIFHIGNVFVARFSGKGPATLPGTRGPIGAHAIEVPHDERNIITLMLVLYTHEFRHNIFADVQGLADELTEAVVGALVQEFQKGNLKFKQDRIAIGRNRYQTMEVLAKLFADTIGEIDADISGGVLLSGPAFLYNMLSTFGALNARGRSVFDSDQLLRTGSFYQLEETEGGLALQFLPHPPDYIRAYIVAAALDEIGFSAEADECRRFADQAVGTVPEFITWEDVDGKSKSVVKFATEDLKQLAPIVARALIRTPLRSLGGLATVDLVNWDARRQAKVDRLVKNLMTGSSEVPSDQGDFYATYVAAASTLAYWGLCKAGARPLHAAASIEENALKMLDTVRERQPEQPLALPPGGGSGDHAAVAGAADSSDDCACDPASTGGELVEKSS